jgi:hypothetical protein
LRGTIQREAHGRGQRERHKQPLAHGAAGVS